MLAAFLFALIIGTLVHYSIRYPRTDRPPPPPPPPPPRATLTVSGPWGRLDGDSRLKLLVQATYGIPILALNGEVLACVSAPDAYADLRTQMKQHAIPLRCVLPEMHYMLDEQLTKNGGHFGPL